MHADNPLNLGTGPSPAEMLCGEFPEWDIWRERDGDGHHGDWVAQHVTTRDLALRASDIPALRQLLTTHRSS